MGYNFTVDKLILPYKNLSNYSFYHMFNGLNNSVRVRNFKSIVVNFTEWRSDNCFANWIMPNPNSPPATFYKPAALPIEYR